MDRRGAIYHNTHLLEYDPKHEGNVRLMGMGWMEGRCDSIWRIAMAWGRQSSRVVTCLTGNQRVRQIARAVLVVEESCGERDGHA
jgi:hypothetical protein